jgi:hypothetical protein
MRFYLKMPLVSVKLILPLVEEPVFMPFAGRFIISLLKSTEFASSES